MGNRFASGGKTLFCVLNMHSGSVGYLIIKICGHKISIPDTVIPRGSRYRRRRGSIPDALLWRNIIFASLYSCLVDIYQRLKAEYTGTLEHLLFHVNFRRLTQDYTSVGNIQNILLWKELENDFTMKTHWKIISCESSGQIILQRKSIANDFNAKMQSCKWFDLEKAMQLISGWICIALI